MSDSKIYQAFGEAVATRRKQLDLTQDKLAARVGISRASIANIERGRQNVALHHAYNLASALDLSKVSDLLPAMSNATQREDKTMPLSGDSLTPKSRAQVSDLVRNALMHGSSKRSGT